MYENNLISSLSFGESIIRYFTEKFKRLKPIFSIVNKVPDLNQALQFLSSLEGETAWLSKLIDNALGKLIWDEIRENIVDNLP